MELEFIRSKEVVHVGKVESTFCTAFACVKRSSTRWVVLISRGGVVWCLGCQ